MKGADVAKEYIPPPIRMGDTIVFWYGHKEQPDGANIGIVTKIGTRTIHALLFSEGSTTGDPRDGIRHYQDPDRGEFDNSGVWDYSPLMKDILMLKARVLLNRPGGEKTKE